ncbi:MAG TPA: hypothetical protein PLQ97_02915 [Myxococcota bacterium]|nr:hypothetical protein [Myxococcota bacterium]HQK50780.1 hypothetical protein [Myxococcota bacterium]
MKRHLMAMTWALAIVGTSLGGGACSSRGRVDPASSEARGAADGGPVATTPDRPPLPSPGRLEDLAAWGEFLPVGTTWVSLVPASDLQQVVRVLPERFPRVVRAIDEAAFRRGIERTWGIDSASLAGDCVVFGVRDKGFAGICPKGHLGQAPGARWQEGTAGGVLVRRGNREFRVGRLGPEGPVVIGDAAAVAEALAVTRRQVPSLGPVLQRRQKELRDVAGNDAFRHGALWVLDPAGIPGGSACRLGALFQSPEGFLAVFLAAEGKETALEQAVRTWWQGTVEAVRQVIGQDPDQQGEPGALGDLFKDADTPLASAEVTLRGDRVFLKGRGNPLWTALAARRDLLTFAFGVPEEGP